MRLCGRGFARGQGFIPNPGKMAFYRVTNPQPKSAKEKSIENLQKSEEGRGGGKKDTTTRPPQERRSGKELGFTEKAA
ncbi:MAG: hypothetical protein HFF62_14975 [Oscillospiraceae bacterium]|nr:hypothetical protein [Oscillospiraceae bacterium]